MSPSDHCRKRFAVLRDAYAQAIAAGDPVKAGNIARKMAKIRKAAWPVKRPEVGWPGRARAARCPAMEKV